jgi:hypothetical protein
MQFICLVFSLDKLRPSKLSRKRRLLVGAIVLFLVTLALAGPVYAQAKLNIDGFYTQVQNTAGWWERMWQSTFLGLGAPSVDAVTQVFTVMMQLVRLIAACVLSVYIVTMFSILARDGLAAFQFMFRGLLVIALISYLFLGNGSNYGSIAYAGKVVFNQVTAAMLQANINGISTTNALTDQIVSSKSKAYLEREIRICDAMPNPAVILPEALSGNFPLDERNPDLNPDQLAAVRRLNCYYRVKGIADELREQAAKGQCFGIPGVNYACAATARFLAGFVDDLENTYSVEFEKLKGGNIGSIDKLVSIGPMFRDYLLGNAAIGFFQGLMYGLQYFFANLQELILFLWALTAPVMAAYSIFPYSSIGGLLQWGVTYISVILSQAYYLLIVGIFASLIQSSETAMLNDILFPFVLGLGAWLIAAGLAAGGAIMAVRSLTNAGVTAISTVGTLGALAVGGPIAGGVVSTASSGAKSVARSGAAKGAARVPSTSRV